MAFRVIADHLRTLSFAIADGIVPGNTDRQLRPAPHPAPGGALRPDARVHGAFFYQLVPVLARDGRRVSRTSTEQQEKIIGTIKTEEENFNRTLDRGIALFEQEARAHRQGEEISGAFAFRLYDEQGFPLDLTQVMAREAGLSVDTAGFERHMEEQRARPRRAEKGGHQRRDRRRTTTPCTRSSSATCATPAWRTSRKSAQDGEQVYAVVNRSPFYAEMGGQVGDTGVLIVGGGHA